MGDSSSFPERTAKSSRGTRRANEPGEGENCHDVGQDLDELHGNGGAPQRSALKTDLRGFGESKKETGESGGQRFPLAENQSREGDEPTTGGHVTGERRGEK